MCHFSDGGTSKKAKTDTTPALVMPPMGMVPGMPMMPPMMPGFPMPGFPGVPGYPPGPIMPGKLLFFTFNIYAI